jgi:hypothetical protein
VSDPIAKDVKPREKITGTPLLTGFGLTVKAIAGGVMIRTFKSCRTYHKPICWCSQDDHSTHNRIDNRGK